MVFPIVMYRCESWTIKKAEHWRIDAFKLVLEKTLKSPLDCKQIKPVYPKGNQLWIFIRRIDSEAEAPILWLPDAKSWLTGKNPGAGEDWGQEEKGVTENELVGWHHRFHGHEFEQTPGDSEGQGSLACCSPWGGKDSDMTEWLNNNHQLTRRGQWAVSIIRDLPRFLCGSLLSSVLSVLKWHSKRPPLSTLLKSATPTFSIPVLCFSW